MNPLRQLQDDVSARLGSTDYLVGIPRFTETLGDVDGAIARALAAAGMSQDPNGKSGVSIVILTPFGKALNNDVAAVVALDVTVRISVFEVPLVNMGDAGIGKPALDVLWQIVSLVHFWTPGPGRKPARLMRFDSDEDDEGRIAYTADFLIPRVFDRTPFS